MTGVAPQIDPRELASALAAAIMRSRATHSTTVERCGVEVRQCRYDSGLIEVAVCTPEIIPGAGKIPRAVVTGAQGKRNWVVHARTERAWIGRSKRRALEFAVGEAIAMDGEVRKKFESGTPL